MAAMRLRVLGVHNMESDDTRLAGYLIGERLALDAGCLARSLTFAEQCAVGTVLITHEHNDHVRDLPALRHSLGAAGASLRVHALRRTLDAISGLYLPPPGAADPAITAVAAVEGEEFTAADHSVRALAVRHSVPAAGYLVSDGEASVFYTGDTGPGLGDVWERIEPDAILAETTFGNAAGDAALRLGHLTPALLGRELEAFRRARGYLPRVIVTHMSPPWEETVRREAAEMAAALGADLTVARAGDTFEISPVER